MVELEWEGLHILMCAAVFSLEQQGKLLLVKKSGNTSWTVPSVVIRVQRKSPLFLEDITSSFEIMQAGIQIFEKQYGISLPFLRRGETGAYVYLAKVPDGTLVGIILPVNDFVGDLSGWEDWEEMWVSPSEVDELAHTNRVGEWGGVLHRIALSAFQGSPNRAFAEVAAVTFSQLLKYFSLDVFKE